jgi:hypothetical protein
MVNEVEVREVGGGKGVEGLQVKGGGGGKFKGKPYEGRVHGAVHKNSVPGKYPVTLPPP